MKRDGLEIRIWMIWLAAMICIALVSCGNGILPGTESTSQMEQNSSTEQGTSEDPSPAYESSSQTDQNASTEQGTSEDPSAVHESSSQTDQSSSTDQNTSEDSSAAHDPSSQTEQNPGPEQSEPELPPMTPEYSEDAAASCCKALISAGKGYTI